MYLKALSFITDPYFLNFSASNHSGVVEFSSFMGTCSPSSQILRSLTETSSGSHSTPATTAMKMEKKHEYVLTQNFMQKNFSSDVLVLTKN